MADTSAEYERVGGRSMQRFHSLRAMVESGQEG